MVALLADDLEVVDLMHFTSESKEAVGRIEAIIARAKDLRSTSIVVCETTNAWELTSEQKRQLGLLVRILAESDIDLLDYCFISKDGFKSFRSASLI